MLTATQLRNNTAFLYKGQPYRVLHYKHTHLSRRGADIKVKVKSLSSGKVLRLNFGSNDKFESVVLEKKSLQFLYQSGDEFVFMDPKSFEQVEISKKIIGQSGKFLKEGESVYVLYWQDQVLGLDLPVSVVLEVSETDPGVKGNSATNIFKNAVLINGLSLRVPLFIKVGDKVKVDTRTGEYIERV